MGTITVRKRADGTITYKAQIRLRRGGVIAHSETQTFERRPAAVAWMKKRERELAVPGAIEAARIESKTLDMAIRAYIENSVRDIGRTKTQVLRTICASDLGTMPCEAIEPQHIVEYLQSLNVQPQTAGNYASHLGAVFAVARPAFGFPLEPTVMRDAFAVCRRLGITGKSRERDRRPTLDELGKLLDHFVDRSVRTPRSIPMEKIILFAMFSTRRQEEIIRIFWDDLDEPHGRILVRDMKNPGEKIGNNVWVDLPDPALWVIASMPRRKAEIFPYSTDAIGRNFTEAVKLLGIEDLHFHDLRHEGVSRLFEMGLNIPHVAAVSGHRSWTGLKRYTHLRATGDRYANWSRLDPYRPPPT